MAVLDDGTYDDYHDEDSVNDHTTQSRFSIDMSLDKTKPIAIKVGLLNKSGRYITRNWHLRVFVLCPHALYYYVPSNTVHPSGCIQLRDLQAVRSASTKITNNCFELISYDAANIYVACKSIEEMNSWISTIKEAKHRIWFGPRLRTYFTCNTMTLSDDEDTNRRKYRNETSLPLSIGGSCSTTAEIRRPRAILSSASVAPQCDCCSYESMESFSTASLSATPLYVGGHAPIPLKMGISNSVPDANDSRRVDKLQPSSKEKRLLDNSLEFNDVLPNYFEQSFPLTFTQRAKWNSLCDAGVSFDEAIHNICVRIRSTVNTVALENALRGIVSKHACLNGSFRNNKDNNENGNEVNGYFKVSNETQMVIRSNGSIALERISVLGFSEEQLGVHLEEEAREPLDSSSHSLIRAQLYMLNESESVLLLSVHALAIDYASFVIILDDLGKFYLENIGCINMPRAEVINTKDLQPEGDLSSSSPRKLSNIYNGDDDMSSLSLSLEPRRRLSSDAYKNYISDPEVEVKNGTQRRKFKTMAEVKKVPTRLTYSDYQSTMANILKSNDGDKHFEYWASQLHGCSETSILELPSSSSRCLKDRRTVRIFGRVSHTLAREFKRLARSVGVSLHAALICNFAILLYRYTGIEDITIGSEVPCRLRPGLDQVVGVMANTLALRTPVIPEKSFSVVLTSMEKSLRVGLLHQDSPIYRATGSGAMHDKDSRRLYNTALHFRRPARLSAEGVGGLLLGDPKCRMKLGGLDMTPLVINPPQCPLDLTVDVCEWNGGFQFAFSFPKGLINVEMADRMTAHFITLIRSAINSPSTRIGRLPIVPDAELALIESWNRTAHCYPDLYVHQLFQKTATLKPYSIAVENASGERFTYAEINAKANTLYHALHLHGVRPGSSIALCVPRSHLSVLGILAILKLGGAYVPLDSTYPRDRIQYMLKNADTTLVLSVCELTPIFDGVDVEVICLDGNLFSESALATYPISNPAMSVSNPGYKSTLAYIIYTSGSTGKPKAIAMPHRALVNLVHWQAGTMSYRKEAKRCLQFAPLSFDVHFQEIFVTFHSAGTVVLMTEEERIDSASLLHHMERSCIERVYLPFIALHQMAEVARVHNIFPSHLKEVRTAGEQLVVSKPLRDFFYSLPNCRLVNDYGPSETHVVLSKILPENVSIWPPLPSIGKPINNVDISIVSPYLLRVPIGVAGELLIGGISNAIGYVHQPDLTASRWLCHPFPLKESLVSPEEQRVHRSGDLCIQRSDGDVVLLGRIDSQVKIRGYRIELGEIEAVLDEHPHVRKNVVTTIVMSSTNDMPVEKQLVAFIVPEQTQENVSLTFAELKNYLSEQLPSYMVPMTYIFMSAFPLTPSGKVDRNALTDHIPKDAVNNDHFTAPRSIKEQVVIDMFSELLHIEHICVFDDFFTLGGTSISATQLLNRLKLRFDVTIPIRKLFTSATVASISKLIEDSVVITDTAIAREGECLNSGHVIEELPSIQKISDLRKKATGSCDDEISTLSFNQHSLWAASQINIEHGSNAAYNVPINFFMSAGNLDIEKFHKSLNMLVARHATLRSRFVITPEGQMAVKMAPIGDVDVISFSVSHDEWDLERAKNHITKRTNEDISLQDGPLIIAEIMPIMESAGGGYIVTLIFHHIIIDMWSLVIIFEELGSLYDEKELPNSPSSFVDYVMWQSRFVNSSKGFDQLKYWLDQLGGSELPVLNLQTDKHRPAVQTYAGSEQRFKISSSLASMLREVSRSHGCTMYTLLLSAFDVLLYRYTGQEDILVGSPMASRSAPETEDMVGYSINTVVMRAKFEPNITFADLLGQVRATVIGALANQEYPFSLLVKKLELTRDKSRTPVFQVMFVLQSPHRLVENGIGSLILGHEDNRVCNVGGLEMQPLDVPRTTTMFDLVLTMADTGCGGMMACFQYNSDIFNTSSISRMAGHFTKILMAVAENVMQSVVLMPVLTSEESDKLLQEWNDTYVEIEASHLTHTAFENIASTLPSHTAIISTPPIEEESDGYSRLYELNYGDLSMRGDLLSRWLHNVGCVKVDTLVAVCCVRSVELATAIIGVVKSGAAYIPMDPAYPKERIAFMINDSSSPVLISQQVLLPRLPEIFQKNVLMCCIDRDWTYIEESAGSNFTFEATPSSLAYAIYTSGSTGRPKGVLIEHHSLVNLTMWHRNKFELTYKDRCTLIAGPGFDASVWELWSSLSVGATITICSDEVRLDPNSLAQWLYNNRITVSFVPTPLIISLLAYKWPMNTELRHVITGGDTLQGILYKQLPFQLTNCYGPSENTVVTTSYCVNFSDDERLNVPPIGRPISNHFFYILDSYMQLVPIGIPGQLTVGGQGLARSYHGLPEKTTKRFVTNPFNKDTTSDRIYFTGDLVRLYEDGNLCYIGRMDFQVKIRGFRIELGEVQVAIVAHPGISEAIVQAREDTPGQKQLVAYIIVCDRSSFSVRDLRQHLQQQVPVYMIPAAFVLLDTFPLTANGKVDMRALPAVDYDNLNLTERVTMAPRNSIEEGLSEIFSDVLGHNVLNIFESFFDIGGYSLSASRVIARIRSRYSVTLTLQTMFESPTIAGLADVVDTLRPESHYEKPQTFVSPLDSVGRFPLGYNQKSLWYLNQLDNYSASYNVVFAAHILKPLSVSLLSEALKKTVERHAILRTTYHQDTMGPMQIVHKEVVIDFQHIDTSSWSNSQIDEEIDAVAHLPFELSVGVLRVVVFSDGAQDIVSVSNRAHILLVAHHIAMDLWSLQVLLRDLNAFYEIGEQLLTNHDSNTPTISPPSPLKVQYIDYIKWQRDLMASTEGEQMLNGWKSTLGDVLAAGDFPIDRPRPASLTYTGDTEHISISEKVAEALRGLAREEGTTLNVVLTAAFHCLVHLYTGQKEVITGTPASCRPLAELEDVVGYFINSVAIKTCFEDEAVAFTKRISATHDVILRALANQECPFSLIVDKLNLPRSPNRSPIFQIMFVYEKTVIQSASSAFSNGQDGYKLNLGSWAFSSTSFKQRVAPFDLTVIVADYKDSPALHVTFQYNTSLFDEDTIKRLGIHFSDLLDSVVENPKTTVADMTLVSCEEKHQLLIEWAGSPEPFPDCGLSHLIEEQVKRTPLRTAVWDVTSGPISYIDFNIRANKLAALLRSIGVSSDKIVAVCMTRNINLIISFVSVMKSGAAFLPIDPVYPKERITFLLEDSNAIVLLTIQSLLDSQVVPMATCNADIICVDKDMDKFSGSNVHYLFSSEQVVNIIYTSGSTGKPKGVLLPYRGLLNLTIWFRDHYNVTSSDRSSQIVGPGFDPTAMELWPFLISGSAVYMVPEDVKNNPYDLVDWYYEKVAYVTQPRENHITTTDLRNFLLTKIPDYMVPRFIFVNSLPLTAHGKVNRRALPLPPSLSSEAGCSTSQQPPCSRAEHVIHEIWSDVLGGANNFGITDNFFTLGGHSLSATKMLSQICTTFKVDLKLAVLVHNPTIAGIVKAIEVLQEGGQATVVEISMKKLLADVVLPGEIDGNGLPLAVHPPKSVFLTGSTGYVGAYLLHDLLLHTNITVYCLVRARSLEMALGRIETNLQVYGLLNTVWSSRIVPVLGNLGLPLLGMTPSQFKSLASAVDLIYHSGSFVNFLYPYSLLYDINVGGTVEIFRLATTANKRIPVHYISTLSVFGAVDSTKIYYENDTLDNLAVYGGYSQSKFVSEKIAMLARDERFIPVAIHRLGRVTGDSETGAANIDDFFCRMLIGIVQMRSAPKMKDNVDMIPVNIVSRAIIHLSLASNASAGNVFHEVNPSPMKWNDVISWMRENRRLPLRVLPYADWCSELAAICKRDQNNALYPLLSLFSDGDIKEEESATYDSKNLLCALEGTGITIPPVQETLLNTYFDYFALRGVIQNNVMMK